MRLGCIPSRLDPAWSGETPVNLPDEPHDESLAANARQVSGRALPTCATYPAARPVIARQRNLNGAVGGDAS